MTASDEDLARLRDLQAEALDSGDAVTAAKIDVAFGDDHLRRGRFDQAERALTRALPILAGAVPADEYAGAAEVLANAYEARGRPGSAADIYLDTRSLLLECGLDRMAAECDLRAGRLLWEDDDLARAEQAYRAALVAFARWDARQQVADSRMGLANVYDNTGRYGEAESMYLAARTDFVELGMELDVARCDYNLGDLYDVMGRFAPAEASLLAARRTFERNGSDEQVAWCDNGLGNLYHGFGRHDEARRAVQQARARFAELELARDVAGCDMSLGNIATALGRPEEAEPRYLEARELFAGLGADRYVAACDLNLGVLRQGTGRPDDAEQDLHRARAGFTRLGLVREVAECDNGLGALLGDMGRFAEAELALEAAVSAFTGLGSTAEVAHCEVNIALTRLQAAGTDTSDREVLRSALDRLIPAALYLDSVRFQFTTAPQRAAWTGRLATVLRTAFALAARSEDARLVAELVETSLNVGVHAAGPDPAGPSPPNSIQPPERQQASASPFTAGAGRLVPGAGRRLAAPPMLRMPDGRIALTTFLDLAQERYGTTGRSAVTVDI